MKSNFEKYLNDIEQFFSPDQQSHQSQSSQPSACASDEVYPAKYHQQHSHFYPADYYSGASSSCASYGNFQYQYTGSSEGASKRPMEFTQYYGSGIAHVSPISTPPPSSPSSLSSSFSSSSSSSSNHYSSIYYNNNKIATATQYTGSFKNYYAQQQYQSSETAAADYYSPPSASSSYSPSSSSSSSFAHADYAQSTSSPVNANSAHMQICTGGSFPISSAGLPIVQSGGAKKRDSKPKTLRNRYARITQMTLSNLELSNLEMQGLSNAAQSI